MATTKFVLVPIKVHVPPNRIFSGTITGPKAGPGTGQLPSPLLTEGDHEDGDGGVVEEGRYGRDGDHETELRAHGVEGTSKELGHVPACGSVIGMARL